VAAELVRRCGGALEIVDASDRVKDLKRAPGQGLTDVARLVIACCSIQVTRAQNAFGDVAGNVFQALHWG